MYSLTLFDNNLKELKGINVNGRRQSGYFRDRGDRVFLLLMYFVFIADMNTRANTPRELAKMCIFYCVLYVC